MSAERRSEDAACSAWPPASCCNRCGGMGGWYKALGPFDWDWTTCQECSGTGDVFGSTPGGSDG